jgi:hypothetical protein
MKEPTATLIVRFVREDTPNYSLVVAAPTDSIRGMPDDWYRFLGALNIEGVSLVRLPVSGALTTSYPSNKKFTAKYKLVRVQAIESIDMYITEGDES